jgi:hypothetical protein
MVALDNGVRLEVDGAAGKNPRQILQHTPGLRQPSLKRRVMELIIR